MLKWYVNLAHTKTYRHFTGLSGWCSI